ncbi:MAG: Spy/CpxP family protein refolding chaperone [Candidatus Omnitrophica bacterium]|nr:Spy/CpxP family protein refolding chaperone [Candidatus Omnitrophota bacterium]
MKKIKNLSVLVALGLILTVSLPNSAYSFGSCGSEGGCGIGDSEGKGKWEGKKCDSEKGEKMEKMMDELGLTDDQKTQLKSMREGNKEVHKALKEKMKANQEAIREELGKDVTDKAKIDSLINESAELYKQKMQGRIDNVLGMKSVLTAEQNAAMKEKMEACKLERAKKHENKKDKQE